MTQSLNVVWFKRDLRIHDHAPLASAAQAGSVLPIYIIEPTYWTLSDVSRRHWYFIHDSLQDLDRDLQQLGASLVIRIGNVVEILESIKQQHGHFTLWSHEETGNDWTYQRDKAVITWCRTRGIDWRETPTNGIVRRLVSRDQWAKIRLQRMSQPLIEAPTALMIPKNVITEVLPSKDDRHFGEIIQHPVQTGGRYAAEKALNSFLKERANKYLLTISKPGVSARHCSRLSAHIAYGTLSIREIEHATIAKMQALKALPDKDAVSMRRNLSAFMSRLAWHCHFIQKLEQQPSLEFKCTHPAFEGMREPYFRDDFFKAWQEGRTGYPLVDACMRSLRENGWITFRMRAMLVSFASYHLWLDWRKTAPYLARLFTDYEPGIHYAQFHMQSGVTGINAVRIYNPYKQSLDQDPLGKFIRRYVPELKDVSDEWIHHPQLNPHIKIDYPTPIVDHEIVVRHAKDQISQQWQKSGFKQVAKQINQKLGSRKNSRRKTTKRKSNSQGQLDLDL
jgi:deoxyribodipyrimidine photo-lyase